MAEAENASVFACPLSDGFRSCTGGHGNGLSKVTKPFGSGKAGLKRRSEAQTEAGLSRVQIDFDLFAVWRSLESTSPGGGFRRLFCREKRNPISDVAAIAMRPS